MCLKAQIKTYFLLGAFSEVLNLLCTFLPLPYTPFSDVYFIF